MGGPAGVMGGPRWAQRSRGAALATADYPRIEQGVRGVRFIERAVASARAGGVWLPF